MFFNGFGLCEEQTSRKQEIAYLMVVVKMTRPTQVHGILPNQSPQTTPNYKDKKDPYLSSIHIIPE
jgi:hypothetical protein